MKSNRIQELKRLLLNKKHVTNTELCRMFNVSIETVRRDLNLLEKEGFLRKVYGGAKLVDNPIHATDPEKWDTRIGQNEENKRSVAMRVAELIPDGCTVYLDIGTSIFEMLPALKKKQNLTVLTNSLRNASELGVCENLTVYCIGGVIRTDRLVSSGFFASDFLTYFSHIDYAIISCDGFSPEKGTTEYSIELAMLKKTVVEKSNYVIVALDHTKFGIPASCQCCAVEKINALVTDEMPMPADVATLREKGVKLVVSEAGSVEEKG